MELITFESQTYQQIENMFKSACAIVKELATENKALKAKVWITAQEVAEMTSYNEQTIRKKKHEIGFKSKGGLLHFKVKDVEAWMERGYIAPKQVKI